MGAPLGHRRPPADPAAAGPAALTGPRVHAMRVLIRAAATIDPDVLRVAQGRSARGDRLVKHFDDGLGESALPDQTEAGAVSNKSEHPAA